MPEIPSELARAVEALRAWSGGQDLRKRTLAEYKRQGGDSAELFGVPMKEIRTVYVRQALTFHLDVDAPPGGPPLVSVLHSLELKKPPHRDFPAVGTFEVKFLLDGSILSCSLDLDNDLIQQYARVRAMRSGPADPA